MLKLGLCDDEKYILSILRKIIISYVEKLGEEVEIECFLLGGRLIEKIEEYDAVFLDIDMPGQDGLEIGKIIYEKKPECKIVMATGYVERFKEAFKINAFRYVTKPFQEEEIQEAVSAIIAGNSLKQTIDVYEQRNLVTIFQKDILYVSAFDGYSEFIVSGIKKNHIFRKDISLNEVEKLILCNLFFRINRQFIINLSKVNKYANGKINIGNQIFTVSRRKKKEFEEALVKYDLSYN